MLKMLCLLAVPCAALCGPGVPDTIYVDDDASRPDAHINQRGSARADEAAFWRVTR